MGQSRPLFVHFHSFHLPIQMTTMQFEQNKLKKSIDGVLGTTQGGRTEGADESTELWRHPLVIIFFFLKMGQPRPLFGLFSVFSNKQYNFTTNICEKCPSSIRCRDSNPRPLERESLSITTRPGLPPFR